MTIGNVPKTLAQANTKSHPISVSMETPTITKSYPPSNEEMIHQFNNYKSYLIANFPYFK
jgi:hypothetical protein